MGNRKKKTAVILDYLYHTTFIRRIELWLAENKFEGLQLNSETITNTIKSDSICLIFIINWDEPVFKMIAAWTTERCFIISTSGDLYPEPMQIGDCWVVSCQPNHEAIDLAYHKLMDRKETENVPAQ